MYSVLTGGASKILPIYHLQGKVWWPHTNINNSSKLSKIKKKNTEMKDHFIDLFFCELLIVLPTLLTATKLSIARINLCLCGGELVVIQINELIFFFLDCLMLCFIISILINDE